jgi:hypothetical protein
MTAMMVRGKIKNGKEFGKMFKMNWTAWLLGFFVGLKLIGFINWPWLWVLTPLWVPLIIAIPMWIIFVMYEALRRVRK